MADDTKDPFDTTAEELEALGFSVEEIENIRNKVQSILSEPEFANALASGEVKLAVTVGDLGDELFGDYETFPIDDDFDWDAMTPEVRDAMEEL